MDPTALYTCGHSSPGSAPEVVLGLQEVTDQEGYSLHPQKLRLGGKTDSEADNDMCFPVVQAAPVLLSKIQIKKTHSLA